MVRLPVHLHEAWTKMRKAEKDLEESLRRRPSFSEIAQHLGWEEDRLQEMYDIVRQPRSMDVPIYTDEGSNLGDVLEDESRMTPDESATADNVKRDVDAMLSELNDREAGVVRMRFGLDDGVEHTLDDIGSRYNVSHGAGGKGLQIFSDCQVQLQAGRQSIGQWSTVEGRDQQQCLKLASAGAYRAIASSSQQTTAAVHVLPSLQGCDSTMLSGMLSWFEAH